MRHILTYFFLFFMTTSVFCAVDIENITLGYNNKYKAGKWVPFSALVHSQNELITFSGEIIVQVKKLISDDTFFRYSTPIQLSKTDRKIVRLYVFIPITPVKLSIQVVRTGEGLDPEHISKPIITKDFFPTPPIENRDYYLLALTPNADKLKSLIDQKQLNDGETSIHVQYLQNTNEMPSAWIGYSTIDVLVLREVSLSDRRLSKKQQDALLEWIQDGGTLIVSGGSNYHYLKDSFIEEALPVKLLREEIIENVPALLKQPFQINTEDSILDSGNSTNSTNKFNSIDFKPKSGCHVIIENNNKIYIAKRRFGSGQIICFAFDYNAHLFSMRKHGEAFWIWLLNNYGKSHKNVSDKYTPYRQIEDKTHKLFLSKMPTQLPIVKLLVFILPMYVICLSFLFFFRFRQSASKSRNGIYWFGCFIFVLFSICTISVAKVVLPKKIQKDSFSILTVYPDLGKVNLQRFISLRTPAHNITSIPLKLKTFIRPLQSDGSKNPPKFLQGKSFQLRDVEIEPWGPSTYTYQTVFQTDLQQLKIGIENTWIITGNQGKYLGRVQIDNSNYSKNNAPKDNVPKNNVPKNNVPKNNVLRETLTKLPINRHLTGSRKSFAQILQSEGLLQYLLNSDDLPEKVVRNSSSKLIGWISELDRVLPADQLMSDRIVTSNDETLVIIYLDDRNSEM